MPNYPYISGQGALIQAFTQLRKGLPPKVDAGYLQRFRIAPANESYVISVLRFLGVIDEEGSPVDDKTDFLFGDDDKFRTGLEGVLRSAYPQVFDEMGDSALEADKEALTSWFRSADKTTQVVGGRQASTFKTISALAGHGELPATRSSGAATKPAAGGAATKKSAAGGTATKKTAEAPGPGNTRQSSTVGAAAGDAGASAGQGVGLTVRVEVNLPPGGDADTYDAIFASIRKHLMS